MNGKQCNKAGYPNQKFANTILNGSRRRKNRAERTYHCRICGLWHLTHEKSDKTVTYIFQRPRDNKLLLKLKEIMANN